MPKPQDVKPGNFKFIKIIFEAASLRLMLVSPQSGDAMKHLIFTLTLALSGLTLAGEACDKPRNDFDGLYCLNKIYLEADRELNANYKTLVPLLDAAGKAKLKSGQLAWQRSRNAECSTRESGGFFVNLDCAASSTIERSQFLQNRIRECKSAGCLNSQL